MPHSQHDENSPNITRDPGAPVTLLADSLEKPLLDDRDYRVVRLDNELEVLLVHDPETDKASAALDVNVGSFSDESDIPGMAHAVEHILFMGTKKFPIKNEYGKYLDAHSGSSNAYTGPTSTNYFFDVAAKPANDQDPSDSNPSPLREALDRFAQFFIEPLFRANVLEGELEVVDDENEKNLRDDNWRIRQLQKSLSNPNHPFCRFRTGNLEVLKTLPEARGMNMRDKVIEFYAEHYSANLMKLVVLGRESLDVLQEWVVELFSPVVNKKLPPNRWPGELPFRESDLGMQCFAKPVQNLTLLILYFPFIDEESMFAGQTSSYIEYLIKHEVAARIMPDIEPKGWVNSVTVKAEPICPGTPGIFQVYFDLTKEGLLEYPEIIKTFFKHVHPLHPLDDVQHQQPFFQELKSLEDIHFKYKEKTSPGSFASRISSVMQTPLPREWLLSGYSHLRTFEPKQIEEALATIRPDNFGMIIVSPNYSGNWDQKEKWYGTEYGYETIPKDLLEECRQAASVSPRERPSYLHFPDKNEFIPNQLEVEKKEVTEPALKPQVLRNDGIARTWWKKDDTFWVPRANITVSLKTPVIDSCAEDVVKTELYTYLVLKALKKYSPYVEVAGSQYSVNADEQGLCLSVSGYNSILPMLLEKVLREMKHLEIKEEQFYYARQYLTREFKNWSKQGPSLQVGHYTNWLNAPDRFFTFEELTEELSHLTLEDLRWHQSQVLSRLFIEVYVHGNMYKEDALKITDMVESILKPRILPPAQWPVLRSLILPRGSNYVFKKTLKDPANVNHCVETWFYVGSREDRVIRTKTLLLDQMLREPAFDQLRTKEHLGYNVFSGPRVFSTTCGFRFLIQGKTTPEFLDSRIEAFLRRYVETLERMSDAEFEDHKGSLVINTLEKPRNLTEESSRHLSQITSGYYDFECAQRDAEQVKKLTKSEMVEFFNQYFDPASSERARLSIHLHAQGKAEGVEKRQEEAQKKAEEEALAGDIPCAISTALEITDVRAFKANLPASSGARPVKDVSEYEDTDVKPS